MFLHTSCDILPKSVAINIERRRGNSSEGYIQATKIANSRVQEEIHIAPPVEHEEVYT